MLPREDRMRQLERCREKAPLIVDVAENIGWSISYGTCIASDIGWKAVTGLQMLSS